MSGTKERLRVGIIGCGLIGQKRAKALPAADKLIACADVSIDRAQALARSSGATAVTDWRMVTADPAIDVVIIATPHDTLAEITLAARGCRQARPGRKARRALRVGARSGPRRPGQKRGAGSCGVQSSVPPVFAQSERARLFRSSRRADVHPRPLRAWRTHRLREGVARKPRSFGRGELIDQGPHLIDLSRWFLGEFSHVEGRAETYFWKMPVDDNGFMLLRTEHNQIAFLHVSCTEWKNLFSLEIYGRNGKLDLNGLGGSYGIERITWYKMLPEMGPPETYSWEYPMADNSWNVETETFLDDVRTGRQDSCGLEDAIAALKVVETIYERSGYAHRA